MTVVGRRKPVCSAVSGFIRKLRGMKLRNLQIILVMFGVELNGRYVLRLVVLQPKWVQPVPLFDCITKNLLHP